jgi:hypothetical protein
VRRHRRARARAHLPVLFMAIAGISGLDVAGDKHPSARQRIQLLLEQLDRLDWTEVMERSAPGIDRWFRELVHESGACSQGFDDLAGSQPDVELCAASLGRLSSDIGEVVAAHVGDLVFGAEQYEAVEEEIEALLRTGIPPSQTRGRQAIGRAEIILGSWLYALLAQGGELEALATAADVPELSLLLPKALEDAALLEAWEAS